MVELEDSRLHACITLVPMILGRYGWKKDRKVVVGRWLEEGSEDVCTEMKLDETEEQGVVKVSAKLDMHHPIDYECICSKIKQNLMSSQKDMILSAHCNQS